MQMPAEMFGRLCLAESVVGTQAAHRKGQAYVPAVPRRESRTTDKEPAGSAFPEVPPNEVVLGICFQIVAQGNSYSTLSCKYESLIGSLFVSL